MLNRLMYTPVVATNHGALPELVTDRTTGLLFSPGTDPWEANNAEGLAEAMIAGLELSGRHESAQLCSALSQHFSWSVLGPEYQLLYD